MQADKIWQAALGELQLQVNKANFNTWLKNTRGMDYADGVFTLAVPSEFVAEWLKNRLYSLVCSTVSGIIGQRTEIQFRVPSVIKEPARSPTLALTDGGVSLKTRSPLFKQVLLNPKFTFDTFVPGDCNRLPYTASIEISNSPGEAFNPFCIYGGTGIGKTHLLHAIGHAATALQQSILYLSAEQFTTAYIASIRNKSNEAFREKFSQVDFLLLDDIQFLSRKTHTQEGLFHIIDELLDNNKQVVVTSDRPPKDIESFNPRLRSRLEGGLLADIYPPDYKMRLDILQVKALQLDAELDMQVLNYLASHFCRDIRELEGSLMRVATYGRVNGVQVNLEIARQILSDVAPQTQQETSHRPIEIINAVANYFAISPDDIISKKRDLKTSRARHIAMYLLRQENHCNLAEIGKLLGGRNHATVIHGCQKISAEISTDSQLSQSLSTIRDMLKLQKNP